jgi:hypothetical protein
MRLRWIWPRKGAWLQRIGRNDPPYPYNYTYFIVGPLMLMVPQRHICGGVR